VSQLHETRSNLFFKKRSQGRGRNRLVQKNINIEVLPATHDCITVTKAGKHNCDHSSVKKRLSQQSQHVETMKVRLQLIVGEVNERDAINPKGRSFLGLKFLY